MTIAEKILKIFKKQDERYKDLIARVEALEDKLNVIKFYIDGTEYKAKLGMTWGEWCSNSEYNILGLRVETTSFGMIYNGSNPIAEANTGAPVDESKFIADGGNYCTMY